MSRITRKTEDRLKKLRPFAAHWNEMRRLVEEMSTRQVRHLIACCDEPSQTNCWVAVYQAAPIVKDLAERKLRRRSLAQGKKRRRRARQAAAKVTP